MKNMSWSSHTFPRELFIEDVRRLSEDYTGEAGSWNFSANTWAEDLCAHLCTHQRRTTLLPGWCCTSRQLIPRLVCWSLGSIWTCVIFIALTSRYESGLSDKIWKKKKRPSNSRSRAVRVVGVSSCARSTWKMTVQNLNNNPAWSNQVKESKHAEPHRSRLLEHSVKNTMQMVAPVVAMTL